MNNTTLLKGFLNDRGRERERMCKGGGRDGRNETAENRLTDYDVVRHLFWKMDALCFL